MFLQLTDSRTITFQLIGKDDNLDDSEILTGRWQAYIDSFVSVCGSLLYSFALPPHQFYRMILRIHCIQEG